VEREDFYNANAVSSLPFYFNPTNERFLTDVDGLAELLAPTL
jgi:hypothetical protein